MKIFFIIVLGMFTFVYADKMDNMQMTNSKMQSSTTMSNDMMNMLGSMYFDFGLGYGTANNFTRGSLAIDAMTMGFYFNNSPYALSLNQV